MRPQGGLALSLNVTVRMMICLEFRGEETISDGGNASSVTRLTRGGNRKGFVAPEEHRGKEGGRKRASGMTGKKVKGFFSLLCAINTTDCLLPSCR